MKFIYGKQDWKTFERGEENCYLMTNGLGGFSSLTAIGSCGRNDHAVLMACVKSPNHRYNMIHRLEETLTFCPEDACAALHISSQDYQSCDLLHGLPEQPEEAVESDGLGSAPMIGRTYNGVREEGYLCQTGRGSFVVRQRLYELEQALAGTRFVRVSNSEIVNLDRVTALDLTLAGTIKMTLEGGTVCWVSRRYVKKIKQALGL